MIENSIEELIIAVNTLTQTLSNHFPSTGSAAEPTPQVLPEPEPEPIPQVLPEPEPTPQVLPEVSPQTPEQLNALLVNESKRIGESGISHIMLILSKYCNGDVATLPTDKYEAVIHEVQNVPEGG